MNQEVPISLLPAGQMLNYANGGYSIGMTGERGFLPGSGGITWQSCTVHMIFLGPHSCWA